MLTDNEREELEMLRASAARFMTDPLDKACFKLESILENNHLSPTIRLMADIILLLKSQMERKK